MTTITNDIDNVLIKLSNLIGNKYEFRDSKIYIPSLHYTLEIFQQERFDERLSCFFKFNQYVLFFEHVYEAIEKRKLYFNENYKNFEEFNKDYLASIYEFIKSNFDELNEFPPKWFLDAVTISSDSYSVHFPELGMHQKSKGEELWLEWNKT